MNLNVYDMDNTLIDSAEITKQCQLEGLMRATADRGSGFENSELYLSEMLRTSGITGLLSRLNIDQDTFFKEYYETFDPYDMIREGELMVFDDVKAYFDKPVYMDLYRTGKCPTGKRPYGLHVIVSNSSLDATRDKLDALDIWEHFHHVFAEFEKNKAKPNPYMATQLAERLKEEGNLNKIRKIINVGDKMVDAEFGEVLYDTLATQMGRKPEFRNYLVYRSNLYRSNTYRAMESIPNVQIIKSFTEIKNE